MYLKEVLKDHDILCCQEHWLMNYEKELLNDIDPDFEVLAKCVDDHNPRLDYKLIRGYGGVCIFWRKSLNFSVKISSQGNDRTIIAEIATEN